MSTKDNRILNPNGGRYPFKVSDEYFDNLTARIMEQIPEDNASEEVPEKNTKFIDINSRRRRNLWISTISIAASLVLIATIALKFIPKPVTSAEQTEDLTAEYTSDNYNEDLVTYAMVDNLDVYYYLSAGDMDE
ncbi:MAG: hypothetical protein IJ693_10340 [Bacteroidaceae bacterium]|nr:hypothetical protein [Bacteroidaceae bacterium]